MKRAREDAVGADGRPDKKLEKKSLYTDEELLLHSQTWPMSYLSSSTFRDTSKGPPSQHRPPPTHPQLAFRGKKTQKAKKNEKKAFIQL